MYTGTTDDGLGWLLNSFLERIPGASSAVVVTADGLVLAISDQIAEDSADQLAAISSGLASLTDGVAQCFSSGPVRQVIVEMAGGYMFLSRISDGSILAVMCDINSDIGMVGYEMSLLIRRIGQVLTPALRAELRPPADFGTRDLR